MYILLDKKYASKSIISSVLNGISAVTKRKKVEIFCTDNAEKIPNGTKIAIVVGFSQKWQQEAVEVLNARGIHPLILGFTVYDMCLPYSCVTFDFLRSMHSLTEELLKKKRGKIAFLGYNPDSLSDKMKLAGVQAAARKYGETVTVFENKGDITLCLEQFLRYGKTIDNIVCGNDYIAVLLCVFYFDAVKDKNLCSCAKSTLSDYACLPYPSCLIDYYKAGEVLARLYFVLLNLEEIHPLTATLEMKILTENGKFKSAYRTHFSKRGEYVNFYGDIRVKEAECLDAMLCSCDDLDFQIINGMMQGYSYEKLAEILPMAVNTIKYRVRMMTERADVKGKKDLLSVLKKFHINLSDGRKNEN